MKLKKVLTVMGAAALAVATSASVVACGDTSGGTKTEKTPFIKEVVILSEPETYYLEGDTFMYDDFALQEIYSDGSKKSVTKGFEFTRQTKSVLVDPDNYVYEDQAVALDEPLTTSDTEVYITYKTTCQGYDLTYNLTQPITVKDPEAADTEIFTVGTNDKIYFYGDGHVESYGIQYAPYVHIPGYGEMVRNDGFWSWNGSELVIVMKNYNPNVSENPDDEYREIIVTKENGTYSFKFEWAAQSENVGTAEAPVYKTYTYGGSVAANDVARRLTSDKKYGDQSLKGKYSKQTDHVKN